MHRPLHLLRSWASMRRAELAGFVLVGLLFGLISISSTTEIKLGDQWMQVSLRQLFEAIATCLILLLVWLPADRSDMAHPLRVRRLVIAVVTGSFFSVVAIALIDAALPWPSVSDIIRAQRHMPPLHGISPWGVLGDTIWVLLPAAMMVGMLELLHRRRANAASLACMLDEHGELRRRAMAAQLAALQAQVEPQLLFDALVDIERAYGEGQNQGPARMESLIRHLRVALPRLRETGSSLEQEAELLDSYLSVLRGLQRAPTLLHTRWAPELRGAAVPPMVLLPLLQRTLRGANVGPRECRLEAELRGAHLVIRMGFDHPGLGAADPELLALKQRVDTLSSGSARLHCDGNYSTDRTTFTLELSA